MPATKKGTKAQLDAFDGDLETAQMRLRKLAEAACKVLDANVLNLASFHLLRLYGCRHEV